MPNTYIHIIHRLRKQRKQYIYTQTNTHARTNIVMLAVKAKQILLMQDDTQHTHSSPSCFSKILSVTHGMPPSLHWMRFDFKYVPSFYRTQVYHFIPLSKTETVLSPVFSLDLNSGLLDGNKVILSVRNLQIGFVSMYLLKTANNK